MTDTAFTDFVCNAHPQPDSANIIQGDRWRICLLTDALVRFEWSDTGHFEDHVTQTVLNRDFGRHVERTVTQRDGRIVIDTEHLHIDYDGKPFSKEGLCVVVKHISSTQFNTWHYGDKTNGNLKGTARTLDEVNGSRKFDQPLEMGDGVISRDGWAVLDDSTSNVIVLTDEVNGKPNLFGSWVSPRDKGCIDLYFFGYAHRYIEAVQDFYRLTGPQPLLPRFAFGNWWSRYYRYTQSEYLALMDRFKREGIPFTTSVIDMDWHLVDGIDPKYGSGWTGYTWNSDLFPDHVAFLDELHRKGLKTTLNVHPRDGIRAFESAYPKAARRMGVDPASGENLEFDLTDPDYMDAYFAMHHDLEAEGVDFWWLDWQQGGVTRQPGLDPLWILNHMHYLDSGRDGRWPLTFSRYAGPGSHRYPVGFSGDTVITWESLAFQPQFTATASNIGYGWWSHDIGGHMFGYRDDELEARWYQLGAFSPINRLHSSNSPFSGKEPWNYTGDVRASMTASLRLRHAMLPYLYTMNYRAAFEGRPIVEPMYWQSPDTWASYEYPDEFRFGTELIVAPIVSAADRKVARGRADLWLPQGEWFDFFDGRRYVARGVDGRSITAWRALDRMPVFARAGAIVPMQRLGEGSEVNSVANPAAMQVLLFPGATGEFTMREDDGVYAHAAAGRTADTQLRWQWHEGASGHADESTVFTVDPVCGDGADAAPQSREWTITVRGVARPAPSPLESCAHVTVGSKTVAVSPSDIAYDEAAMSLTLTVRDVPTRQQMRVVFTDGLRIAQNPVEQDCYEILLHAQIQFLAKEKALTAIREEGVHAIGSFAAINKGPRFDGDFLTVDLPESVVSALEEVLLRS